jgi:hypothetical protein
VSDRGIHGVRPPLVHWTDVDDAMLRDAWRANTAVPAIALRLGRSEGSVYMHARAIGLPQRGLQHRSRAHKPTIGQLQAKALTVRMGGTMQAVRRMEGMSFRACQWIEGEAHPDGHCGARVVAGGPYCGAHRARAYKVRETGDAG